MQITTIGLDLAKSWFQVHGVTCEAHDLGVLFAESRTQFDDLMLQKAPIVYLLNPAELPIPRVGRCE